MPFDITIDDISELPYSISYVVRKKSQIDSFRELPKEKRPTETMIWEGSAEELENWFDKVFDRKNKYDTPTDLGLIMEIDKKLIEG